MAPYCLKLTKSDFFFYSVKFHDFSWLFFQKPLFFLTFFNFFSFSWFPDLVANLLYLKFGVNLSWDSWVYAHFTSQLYYNELCVLLSNCFSQFLKFKKKKVQWHKLKRFLILKKHIKTTALQTILFYSFWTIFL